MDPSGQKILGLLMSETKWEECIDNTCTHRLYISKEPMAMGTKLRSRVIDEQTLALYILRYGITQDELENEPFIERP
jgi:hypothetical protein